VDRRANSVPHKVAEVVLSHGKAGDKLSRAYQRGELFGKRRQLMDLWARLRQRRHQQIFVKLVALRGWSNVGASAEARAGLIQIKLVARGSKQSSCSGTSVNMRCLFMATSTDDQTTSAVASNDPSQAEHQKQSRRSKLYETGLGILIWGAFWVAGLAGLYALSHFAGD